jgi:hypothetical protein
MMTPVDAPIAVSLSEVMGGLSIGIRIRIAGTPKAMSLKQPQE